MIIYRRQSKLCVKSLKRPTVNVTFFQLTCKSRLFLSLHLPLVVEGTGLTTAYLFVCLRVSRITWTVMVDFHEICGV